MDNNIDNIEYNEANLILLQLEEKKLKMNLEDVQKNIKICRVKLGLENNNRDADYSRVLELNNSLYILYRKKQFKN